MDKQPEALQIADDLEYSAHYSLVHTAVDELRRLHHNNGILLNALWKACGDDKDVVNATIDSQGELK